MPRRPSARVVRPSPWVEHAAQRLYLALAPRLPRSEPREPPPGLRPYELLPIARSQAPGALVGTLYRARESAVRGVVVLAHPWHAHGQGYFHRRGRIAALRDAGYHALTFDFGGFGRSGPRPRGFFDRDLADVLDAARRLAAGAPVHLWGVSAGGYWAHLVLARRPVVAGAVFEDVAVHLIEWSKRLAPSGLPFYLVFQHVLGPAYRFLDLRAHAPAMQVGAAAYIGGEADRGALPDDTRELARSAGATCHIVAGAGHLEAIRLDSSVIIEHALATFERAEVILGSGARLSVA